MPVSFAGLDSAEAAQFAAEWLPAWSGNHPDRLIEFYADDVFYRDPAVPDGIKGRAPLLEYFRVLLRRNPNWQWQQLQALPLLDGFLNFWEARIPVADQVVVVQGVCTVQLRDGLIYRNEVFFDRSEWLKAFPARPTRR